MSKQIIEEHMGGNIKALNIKYKINNKMYDCAMFEILIPIKEKDEKL